METLPGYCGTRIITVNKIFCGYASIRSHIFQSILRNKENLLIKHGDRSCFIPFEQLERISRQLTHKTFQSKFDPSKSYSLIDIPFNPIKVNANREQFSLFKQNSGVI